MTKYDLVTPAVVRQLLDYDPETGELRWKHRDGAGGWNARFAGAQAFAAVADGYNVGTLCRRTFFAHRVAFAHAHGVWPDGLIDHKNRDRSDNRISNLTVVDHHGNAKNKSAAKNNSSGITGVSWNAAKAAWEAYIAIDGRRVRLGFFDTLCAAGDARKAAEKENGCAMNRRK